LTRLKKVLNILATSLNIIILTVQIKLFSNSYLAKFFSRYFKKIILFVYINSFIQFYIILMIFVIEYKFVYIIPNNSASYIFVQINFDFLKKFFSIVESRPPSLFSSIYPYFSAHPHFSTPTRIFLPTYILTLIASYLNFLKL